VKDSLSWFINAYATFASWRAAVDRLTSFDHDIRTAQREQRSAPGITLTSDADAHLRLEGVALDLPGGAPLLAPASLAIAPGSRVLIQGPSGSGKSTLLCAIAGIWRFGRGVIRTPRQFEAFFVPHGRYFPMGTLRRAVCYPAAPDAFSDSEIQAGLESTGLAHLIARLDESLDWSEELSGADQQRIAFVRVLLRRPAWVFLDEATSELDEDSRARLYGLLTERLPNASVVTLAPTADLRRFHSHVWNLRKIGAALYELRQAELHSA
jgi:putative ATP-binding cassette transporter